MVGTQQVRQPSYTRIRNGKVEHVSGSSQTRKAAAAQAARWAGNHGAQAGIGGIMLVGSVAYLLSAVLKLTTSILVGVAVAIFAVLGFFARGPVKTTKKRVKKVARRRWRRSRLGRAWHGKLSRRPVKRIRNGRREVWKTDGDRWVPDRDAAPKRGTSVRKMLAVDKLTRRGRQAKPGRGAHNPLRDDDHLSSYAPDQRGPARRKQRIPGTLKYTDESG